MSSFRSLRRCILFFFLFKLYNLCNFSLQGINIVGPSNAEPTPRPPSPAMYQLDIVLKKGNNLAIRDRTGRSSVYSSCYLNSIEVYVERQGEQLYRASCLCSSPNESHPFLVSVHLLIGLSVTGSAAPRMLQSRVKLHCLYLLFICYLLGPTPVFIYVPLFVIFLFALFFFLLFSPLLFSHISLSSLSYLSPHAGVH